MRPRWESSSTYFAHPLCLSTAVVWPIAANDASNTNLSLFRPTDFSVVDLVDLVQLV